MEETGTGKIMRRKMSLNLDMLSFRYHENIQMELSWRQLESLELEPGTEGKAEDLKSSAD